MLNALSEFTGVDSMCALMQCTVEPVVCIVMHKCCFCNPQNYWLAELTVQLEQNEPAGGQQLGAYRNLKTYAAVKELFEGQLAMYNASRKPMQLVLFDDALEQLLRMHRTLCLPQARIFIPASTGECLRTTAIHSKPVDTFHALLHASHCLVLYVTDIHMLFCCCLSAECRGDTCVLGQARPLGIPNMQKF